MQWNTEGQGGAMGREKRDTETQRRGQRGATREGDRSSVERGIVCNASSPALTK